MSSRRETSRDVPVGTDPRAVASDDAHLAAFEQAVHTSARTLWSIAAAVLGRRSDAEDVVQDAVVVALGKRQEFGKVQNFTAWMAQIVRFVALNRRRAAKLRSAEGEESLQHVAAYAPGGENNSPPTGPESVVDRVTRALAGLEETQRACFLLRVVNELSYQEIGAALSIPEGTAMSHVFRARRALSERLSGSHETPTPQRPRHA
jgi:RNA polymerase sigma-70 factor, ECF subfamily